MTMKSAIDTRLSRLEARQPRKGRWHKLIVSGTEYDPEEELRKRGIVLGPDDNVMWIELVGVYPPDRPPWNEGRPSASRGEE
jgi:hypothetical protein